MSYHRLGPEMHVLEAVEEDLYSRSGRTYQRCDVKHTAAGFLRPAVALLLPYRTKAGIQSVGYPPSPCVTGSSACAFFFGQLLRLIGQLAASKIILRYRSRTIGMIQRGTGWLPFAH